MLRKIPGPYARSHFSHAACAVMAGAATIKG